MKVVDIKEIELGSNPPASTNLGYSRDHSGPV